MSLFSRILGKREDDRAQVRSLWHRVVEIAREKQWYAQCGIADTVPGRFDAITLVLALVMLRMERSASLIAPSAKLTELFVADMDGQLRQSGVGDLVVGKRMGKLMGALGGRLEVLRGALPQGAEALEPVVKRNLTLIEGADVAALAVRVTALADQLDAVSDEDLLAGTFTR